MKGLNLFSGNFKRRENWDSGKKKCTSFLFREINQGMNKTNIEVNTARVTFQETYLGKQCHRQVSSDLEPIRAHAFETVKWYYNLPSVPLAFGRSTICSLMKILSEFRWGIQLSIQIVSLMLHDRHLLSNLVQIIQIYFCNAHIISFPALSNHAAPWIHDLQLDNNKEYKKNLKIVLLWRLPTQKMYSDTITFAI